MFPLLLRFQKPKTILQVGAYLSDDSLIKVCRQHSHNLFLFEPNPKRVVDLEQKAAGAEDFTRVLKSRDVKISMDGKGRALDNVFVERVWRSLKYEEVYLHDYGDVREARTGIGEWFDFYGNERPHQALGGATPMEVYRGKVKLAAA